MRRQDRYAHVVRFVRDLIMRRPRSGQRCAAESGSAPRSIRNVIAPVFVAALVRGNDNVDMLDAVNEQLSSMLARSLAASGHKWAAVRSYKRQHRFAVLERGPRALHIARGHMPSWIVSHACATGGTRAAELLHPGVRPPGPQFPRRRRRNRGRRRCSSVSGVLSRGVRSGASVRAGQVRAATSAPFRVPRALCRRRSLAVCGRSACSCSSRRSSARRVRR